MSYFGLYIDKILKHEGMYSTDPIDTGGETFMGISRRFNPSWSGWNIIDIIKKGNNSSILYSRNILRERYPELINSVGNFYKKEYWDRIKGDDMQHDDIAYVLFDSSVNLGVKRTITFLQESLNVLNSNIHSSLSEDGILGVNTLISLNRNVDYYRTTKYLIKAFMSLRYNHYIGFVRTNFRQRRFIRGWMNRMFDIEKEIER